MVVDKLFDERYEIRQRLCIKGRDLSLALRFPEVRKIDFPVLGEQVWNHFRCLFVYRDMVTKAQLLNFIPILEFPHSSFERRDTSFEIRHDYSSFMTMTSINSTSSLAALALVG